MPTPSAPHQVVLGLFQDLCNPPLRATVEDLVNVFAAFEKTTGIAVYSSTNKLGDEATIRPLLEDDLQRLTRDEQVVLNKEGHYQLRNEFKGSHISTATLFLLLGDYLQLGPIARRVLRPTG